MSTDLRTEVLSIFERHRQTPGAAFEESHFIDYLLDQSKGIRTVHNSFRGLRRYNKFVEDVQMHFGVYLSIKDWGANRSLEQFVERVAKLQSSARSSRASFRSHVQRGFGWNTVFVVSFLGGLISYALWRYSQAASLVVLLVVAVGEAWALKAYLHWRSYHRALETKLGHSRDDA